MTMFVRLDKNNRPVAFFDDGVWNKIPSDTVELTPSEFSQLRVHPHRVTFDPSTRIIGITAKEKPNG